MVNNVFFGTSGLTATSANYYANIAQEMVLSLNKKLGGIVLFDTKLRSIASSEELTMSIGTSDISFVQPGLEEVGKMNAFCAWMREAIKEQQKQLIAVKDMYFDKWKATYDVTITMPRPPEEAAHVDGSDIIAGWNVEKRNKYYTLEAMASTYGKYIHPQGPFAIARDRLQSLIAQPIIKEGSGTNTILYYHNPSVDPKLVESKFLELQTIYREYEKELNFMKASIKEEVNKRNLIIDNNYKDAYSNYHAELEKYRAELQKVQAQFNSWKIKETERIANLKIVVPPSMEEIFSKIKQACEASK